jgi:tetratricopeptide (TPR) repeat protein
VLTIDLALELASKAVTLDDAVPQTHWALGYVHLMRGEYALAESAASRAIEIAPNFADAYGLLALIKNALAEPDAAIELIRKGMQLNPFYTWDYPYNLGRAYYTAGNLEAAIASLEKARTRNPNALPIRLYLAASYAGAGRVDDAEWEMEEVKALNPNESISLLKATHSINDPQVMQRLVQDLRSAGLPE